MYLREIDKGSGLGASIAATFAVGVGGTLAGSDTGSLATVLRSIGLAAASLLGKWLWSEPLSSDASPVATSVA